MVKAGTKPHDLPGKNIILNEVVLRKIIFQNFKISLTFFKVQDIIRMLVPYIKESRICTNEMAGSKLLETA